MFSCTTLATLTQFLAFGLSSHSLIYFLAIIHQYYFMHDLNIDDIFFVLCVCHFQFQFKLIMIFWPNKLFFYFILFLRIHWFRHFWLTCFFFYFCIYFRFPKYTLMMVYFLFSFVSILIIIFSAWVSGIGCPACALRL